MSAVASATTTPSQLDPAWDHHYKDERDAAFMYRALASAELNGERRELFEKLAHVEDRHVERWEQLFRDSGRTLPEYKTALRTRVLAWAARRFGTSLVLPLMLAEEGREVQAYLGLARLSTDVHSATLEQVARSTIATSTARMMRASE